MTFLKNILYEFNYLSRNSAALNPLMLINGALSWFFYNFSRSGRSFAPISLKIGVNSICNARCKFCDKGTGNKETIFYKNMCIDNRDLDYHLIVKALSSIAIYRPKVTIDTTEPLLYSRIFDLIRHIKTKRMTCMIQTNGLLLEQFKNDLITSGLDDLGVSIDGTSEVHNEIRGVPGMYERIFAGLHKIDELKRERAVPNPRISINYVISEYNSQDVMVEFVKELSKRSLSISRVNFYHQNFISKQMALRHNKSWEHLLPVTVTNCAEANPENIDCKKLNFSIQTIKTLKLPFAVKWIPHLSNETDLKLFYKDHFHVVGHARCVVPWFVLRIRPDGSVGTIARCYNISFGNIADQSVTEIFNSAPFRNFRKLIKKEKILPACLRCCGLF